MYHKKRTLCILMRCSWRCLNVIVFFAQVRPTGLTPCHLWTWRESLCLSWELGHQGAMGWRLYNCWSMNMVCCEKSSATLPVKSFRNPTHSSLFICFALAYGREMNIQLSGNSSGGHSCSQHANCMLPQLETSVVLCDKTAHFRVAFYCPQHKVHLCNDHAV